MDNFECYVAELAQELAGEASALLLTCMDYRYADRIIKVMEKQNLKGKYDIFVLAGAAAGANQKESWRSALMEHIRTARLIGHKITKIIILEHRDCGAYKQFFGLEWDKAKPLVETLCHEAQAAILAKYLKAELSNEIPGLTVESFLMPREEDDKLNADRVTAAKTYAWKMSLQRNAAGKLEITLGSVAPDEKALFVPQTAEYYVFNKPFSLSPDISDPLERVGVDFVNPKSTTLAWATNLYVALKAQVGAQYDAGNLACAVWASTETESTRQVILRNTWTISLFKKGDKLWISWSTSAAFRAKQSKIYIYDGEPLRNNPPTPPISQQFWATENSGTFDTGLAWKDTWYAALVAQDHSGNYQYVVLAGPTSNS